MPADIFTPDTYYGVTLKVKLPKYWVGRCVYDKIAVVELINDYKREVISLIIKEEDEA